MTRLLLILLLTVLQTGLAAQGSGNAPLAELGEADSRSDSAFPFLVTRTVAGKILWIKTDHSATLIVVEDGRGRRGVFTINQKTRFKGDKKTEYAGKKHISVDDLVVGQVVKVTFIPDDGRVVQLRLSAKA